MDFLRDPQESSEFETILSENKRGERERVRHKFGEPAFMHILVSAYTISYIAASRNTQKMALYLCERTKSVERKKLKSFQFDCSDALRHKKELTVNKYAHPYSTLTSVELLPSSLSLFYPPPYLFDVISINKKLFHLTNAFKVYTSERKRRRRQKAETVVSPQ